MKKWMVFVAATQIVGILIWLTQTVRLWPDDLWFAGWVLDLPGSVLGPWAAERLLWMRVSLWTTGLIGLALATLINLAIAYGFGAVCGRIYEVLKRKRRLRSHPDNEH